MAIRTAFLTNFIPPYRLKLLSALHARLGELTIFVSTEMEADRPWTPDSGTLNVIRQKTRTFERTRLHPSGCTQRLFIHFPYDTLAQLWRYEPKVVISSELGLRSLQAAIYRKFFPRSRLIIWATLSEETEKGWGIVRRILRRVILASADAVMCNGSSGARYIAGFGVPADRIILLNQPVDVDLFVAQPVERKPEAARRLVFSGRLIPQKAVVELQNALKSWTKANPERSLEMVWIGDGELRERLENEPTPPNFRQIFRGSQTYDALPGLYADCGVLVLPSLMDEWGLVVNEAMASGMVVLGSIYSQAAIEMVKDGETGWLIDPLTPSTIESALDALFAAPLEKLTQMRFGARKRALIITPEGAAETIHSTIRRVALDDAGNKSKRKANRSISIITTEPAAPLDTLQ